MKTSEHCDVKKINKQIGFNRARLKVKEKLLFLYVILKLYVNNFLVFGKWTTNKKKTDAESAGNWLTSWTSDHHVLNWLATFFDIKRIWSYLCLTFNLNKVLKCFLKITTCKNRRTSAFFFKRLKGIKAHSSFAYNTHLTWNFICTWNFVILRGACEICHPKTKVFPLPFLLILESLHEKKLRLIRAISSWKRRNPNLIPTSSTERQSDN